MIAKTLKQEDLNQFTGTETWFRHWANKNLLFTEGVHYVAEHGGALWLVDEIAFAQKRAEVKREEFQHWVLHVNTDRSARLACDDGNGNEVYVKQIEFTDFPLPEIQFYFTDNVLLLPREY